MGVPRHLPTAGTLCEAEPFEGRETTPANPTPVLFAAIIGRFLAVCYSIIRDRSLKLGLGREWGSIGRGDRIEE